MNGDRAVAKHETPLQRAQEWLALTPRERAARRMQATEIITLLSDSLSAIEIGRASIHAQFRNGSRDADGNCQCAYCRGDAGQLGELAADYELRLAGETYRREAAEAALALQAQELNRAKGLIGELTARLEVAREAYRIVNGPSAAAPVKENT